MKHGLVLLASMAALSACNKGPDVNVKNASIGEVAEKVRDSAGSASLVEPGRWQTKVTMLEMDIPGMPPQVAARMKSSMGQERSYETCLTPEDVKKPKADFFAGKSNDCRYDHFTMSGGKIDAVMHCEAKAAGAMTMTMNGTYSSDSYEATMAMEVNGGRDGRMRMKSHSESHRIGECTGKEDNS